MNKGTRLQPQFAVLDPWTVLLFTWTCKSWWSRKAVSCQAASRELWPVDQHLLGSRRGRMGVCLRGPRGSQRPGFAHSSPADSQEIWLCSKIWKDWDQLWNWRSKRVSKFAPMLATSVGVLYYTPASPPQTTFQKSQLMALDVAIPLLATKEGKLLRC